VFSPLENHFFKNFLPAFGFRLSKVELFLGVPFSSFYLSEQGLCLVFGFWFSFVWCFFCWFGCLVSFVCCFFFFVDFPRPFPQLLAAPLSFLFASLRALPFFSFHDTFPGLVRTFPPPPFCRNGASHPPSMTF